MAEDYRSKITGLPTGFGAQQPVPVVAAPRPVLPASVDAPETSGVMEFLKRIFGIGNNTRQGQLDNVLGQLGATPGGRVAPAVGAAPGQ